MTPAQAREAIAAALASIAPEVDLTAVDPDAELTDELDLDSMDLLELRTAVLASTGVEIAPDDPAGSTLAGLIGVIADRSAEWRTFVPAVSPGRAPRRTPWCLPRLRPTTPAGRCPPGWVRPTSPTTPRLPNR